MRRFTAEELKGHPAHIHYVTFRGQVLLHDSSRPEMRSAREGIGMPEITSTSMFTNGQDLTLFCAVQYHEPRYAEEGVTSVPTPGNRWYYGCYHGIHPRVPVFWPIMTCLFPGVGRSVQRRAPRLAGG